MAKFVQIAAAGYAESNMTAPGVQVALFALDDTGRIWRMLDATLPVGNKETGPRWCYLPFPPRMADPTGKPIHKPRPGGEPQESLNRLESLGHRLREKERYRRLNEDRGNS